MQVDNPRELNFIIIINCHKLTIWDISYIIRG